MKQGTFTEDGAVIAMAGNAGTVNTLYLWGNFGGGEVVVDITPDGSEFFDLLDPEDAQIAFSAKGFVVFEVKTRGVRLTLEGATAPEINWAIL